MTEIPIDPASPPRPPEPNPSEPGSAATPAADPPPEGAPAWLGAYADQPPAAPGPYNGPVKTDGFAITALVLGLLGASVLAIIFGILGLRRIRRSNGAKTGRGLAIAGIALGTVVLLITAALLTVAFVGAADRDDDGDIVGGGSIDAMQIEVGDCLEAAISSAGQTLDSVRALPCAEPHTSQILARFDLTGSIYPGEDAVTGIAEDRCSDLVANSLNAASDAYELSLIYLYPTELTWTLQDDREVLCGVGSDTDIAESLLDE